MKSHCLGREIVRVPKKCARERVPGTSDPDRGKDTIVTSAGRVLEG